MFCTFALDTKVPRIVPGGTVSAGYPGLTPAMDVPCVPRVGEVIFLQTATGTNQHTVTSVRYIVHSEKGMSGAVVLLSDGKPVE
jgi:hypothetical protein